MTIDQPGVAGPRDELTTDEPEVHAQTHSPIPLVWQADPTELALAAAGWRRDHTGPRPTDLSPGRVYLNSERLDTVPDQESEQEQFGPSTAFCTEIGRQLLLYQFTFSSWVLRRVEKVHFQDEFSLSRRTSIELLVPEDAPILRTAGGAAIGAAGPDCWLVPLSIMRRRTLVNLDIRDEEGGSISLLGLRFTQKLDEAMLRAAARLAVPDRELPARLELFIENVVSGGWHDVAQAKKQVPTLRQLDELGDYLRDDIFNAALARMWHNFTLYAALPVERGRHRLLRLAFEEPVRWGYQKPSIEPADPDVRSVHPEALTYKPFGKKRRLAMQVPARLGFAPTRVRFLTPGAEHCASYHFEFTAPPGLRVAKARLLAGRPNVVPDSEKRLISVDCDDDGGVSTGLHAVEIPNVSLSRAAVDLRVASSGWLATLVVWGFVALASVGAVMWHFHAIGRDPAWLLDQQPDELTSIFVLLVTITAGAATYVAHNDTRHVTSKMLTWLRAIGALVIALPAIVGTLLVFYASSLDTDVRILPDSLDFSWRWRIGALVVIATFLWVLIVGVWFTTWRSERRSGRLSLWNMTGVGEERTPILPGEDDDLRYDFDRLAESLDFKKWAVGVVSAEGWHEDFSWSNDRQQRAVEQLRAVNRGHNPTMCTCGIHEPPAGQPS